MGKSYARVCVCVCCVVMHCAGDGKRGAVQLGRGYGLGARLGLLGALGRCVSNRGRQGKKWDCGRDSMAGRPRVAALYQVTALDEARQYGRSIGRWTSGHRRRSPAAGPVASEVGCAGGAGRWYASVGYVSYGRQFWHGGSACMWGGQRAHTASVGIIVRPWIGAAGCRDWAMGCRFGAGHPHVLQRPVLVQHGVVCCAA